MIHVIPPNDDHHNDGGNCWCRPEIRAIDPDTGLAYPGGPIVIHRAMGQGVTSADIHAAITSMRQFKEWMIQLAEYEPASQIREAIVACEAVWLRMSLDEVKTKIEETP